MKLVGLNRHIKLFIIKIIICLEKKRNYRLYFYQNINSVYDTKMEIKAQVWIRQFIQTNYVKLYMVMVIMVILEMTRFNVKKYVWEIAKRSNDKPNGKVLEIRR